MNLRPPDQQPAPEFMELVQRVLDHEASLDDIAQLNAILPQDPAALRYFVKLRQLHAALENEFKTASTELDSITGQIVDLPVSKQASITPNLEDTKRFDPAQSSKKWRIWAAAAILLISVTALWTGREIFQRPAFEIVARSGTSSSVPALGTWLNNGDHLNFEHGFLEVRSASGATLTFSGPSDFTIRNAHELQLNKGKLWAVIEEGSIQVSTPHGEVTDLGTTFGIDQSKKNATRIDVFDGKVQLADSSDSSRQATADAGQGLSIADQKWPPRKLPADASRYAAGLRMPIGLVFSKDSDQSSLIEATLPLGAQWTSVSETTGNTKLVGASFEIAWAGSSFFHVGSEQSPEAALFHSHLIGNAWKGQFAATNDKATALGLPLGPGIVIQLRGMTSWLTEIGASSYRLAILRNSSVPNVEFLPVSAHSGASIDGPEFAIQQLWSDDYLSANYPDNEEGEGARAIGAFKKEFMADTLTLSLPVEPSYRVNRRTNVSALVVTPVF